MSSSSKEAKQSMPLMRQRRWSIVSGFERTCPARNAGVQGIVQRVKEVGIGMDSSHAVRRCI